MNMLRVSPMVAKLLDTPENRALFERERSIGSYLVGIEEAMATLKISKSKLAEMAGKKIPAISRAMQGKQNLTVGTMVDLAVVLGKKVEIRVIDLDKIEVATTSRANECHLSQKWAADYISTIKVLNPYKLPNQVVQGATSSIS